MSSKRAKRRRSCTSKKKLTKQEAHYSAYKARQRSGQYILPYKCKFCGNWHVGHPPAKVKQAIIDRRQ